LVAIDARTAGPVRHANCRATRHRT
jgi:hypothetical protein